MDTWSAKKGVRIRMERGWIEMIVPSHFLDKYLLSHTSLPAHHFWHIPLRWLLWRSGSTEMQWAMKESFPRDLTMICYSLLWNWKCTLPLSILQGGVPHGRDDRIEPCGQWVPLWPPGPCSPTFAKYSD